MTSDARHIVAALRAPGSLHDALTGSAQALRETLGARGVSLVVRREGREVRGDAGTLGEDARAIPLSDHDVDATLLVDGAEIDDALIVLVSLALAARFLSESAHTDGLTGVANRRTLDERLREEWRRAEREGASLAVAILDLDFFKVLNDRRGHPAGDDALRRVAQAASATLQRAGDRFARYGGEEFVAILPSTPLSGAIAAAERMRAAVAALNIPHPLGRDGHLSVSIGVAVAEPRAGGTCDELLSEADRQLYRAKEAGRDRVAADGYASQHVPTESLPQPLSTLIGRDDDREAVEQAIATHRVVTLVGTAGVGKTRLALAVAQEADARIARVRFVDALGARDRADLELRIAGALGIAKTDDVARSIAAAPREPTLLVLDGCERIADAAREVVDALATLSLRFLVTSRVALGANDEAVVQLEPLDPAAARALFERRAATAGVAANVDDTEIDALLRRLAGMPFAIELAVGRLASRSASQLASEFAGAVPSGEADRATLGSLLASTVASLHRDDAGAFAAATTFRGDFTSADAATLIPSAGGDPREADGVLRRLAARSLVDVTVHAGAVRWRTSETVRAAAAELPLDAAVRVAIARAYVRWCRERLEVVAARSGPVTNRPALLENEAVIAEVRYALDRSLHDDALLPDGAELCIAALTHWYAIRHVSEGRARCAAFLERGALLDPIVRIRLEASAARLAFLDGDVAAMDVHARAASALLGGRDSIELATVLNFLGVGAKSRGDADGAEQMFVQSRALNARIGHLRGEAIAISALASIAYDIRVDVATAIPRFEEAIAIFQRIGDDVNALAVGANLAEALTVSGDPGRAQAVIEAVFVRAHALGDRATRGHVACVRALIADAQGDTAGAAHALRDCIENGLSASGASPLVVMALDAGARIVFAAGEAAVAAHLVNAAEAHASAHAMPLLPVQRRRRDPLIASLRAELGEAAFASAEARGRWASAAESVALLNATLAAITNR